MITKLCFFSLLMIGFFSATAQNEKNMIIDEVSYQYLAMDEFSLSLSNPALKIVPFDSTYIASLKIKTIVQSIERKRDTNYLKYSFDTKGLLTEIKSYAALNKDVETFSFKEYTSKRIAFNQRYIGKYIDMNYDTSCAYKDGKIANYKQVDLLSDTLREDEIHTSKKGDYVFIKDDAWVTKCFFYLKESEDIHNHKQLKEIIKKVISDNDAHFRRGILFYFIDFKNEKINKRVKIHSKQILEDVVSVEDFYYNGLGFLVKIEDYFSSTPNEKSVKSFVYKNNMLSEVSYGYMGNMETKVVFLYDKNKVITAKNYHFNKNYKDDLESVVKYRYSYY